MVLKLIIIIYRVFGYAQEIIAPNKLHFCARCIIIDLNTIYYVKIDIIALYDRRFKTMKGCIFFAFQFHK